MADVELASVNNSGNLTNFQKGGVDVGDKLLSSDEIAATYETITNVDTIAARVTVNEADLVTNTANISTNTADIATNTGDIASIDGRVTILESSHELLLNAASTATTQQPTVLDTALQIEFGVAQSTTDIDISAAGAITFNTAGKYIIATFFQYGRVGAVGVSVLFNRILVNGTQLGGSLGAKVDDDDTLVPWSSSFQFTAAINDVVTVEIIRDSTGNNSGGLFSASPTIGWNLAPCAAIQIYKAT